MSANASPSIACTSHGTSEKISEKHDHTEQDFSYGQIITVRPKRIAHDNQQPATTNRGYKYNRYRSSTDSSNEKGGLFSLCSVMLYTICMYNCSTISKRRGDRNVHVTDNTTVTNCNYSTLGGDEGGLPTQRYEEAKEARRQCSRQLRREHEDEKYPTQDPTNATTSRPPCKENSKRDNRSVSLSLALH